MGVTFWPGMTFCRPSTTTRSPGLEPLSDNEKISIALPQGDSAEGYFVVLPHHEDADFTPCSDLHGPLGHQEGVGPLLQHYPDAAEQPGPEQPLGLGKFT